MKVATGLYFPPPADAGTWEPASPSEAGWDSDALDSLTRYCAECGSSALVIVHQGRILAEHYWSGAGPDTTRDVASVQKAAVSLLAGILAGTGKIGLDEPAARWLGRGWSRTAPGQEDSIRLRHLMTMTSGLYDDFSFEAPPGTAWYYNNNGYHQLRQVLEAAAGVPFRRLFASALADPVGMQHARWVDRPGTTDPNGRPLAGLRCSARDLARIGLLVLAGGSWAGQEVLPDPASLSESLRPSQPLNPSYGRLWWLPTEPSALLPGGAVTDPRKSFGGVAVSGPIIPAAPGGLVAGFGAGVQRLYISPTLGVVAVRLGAPPPSDGPGQRFDQGFWLRLMSAVPAS